MFIAGLGNLSIPDLERGASGGTEVRLDPEQVRVAITSLDRAAGQLEAGAGEDRIAAAHFGNHPLSARIAALQDNIRADNERVNARTARLLRQFADNLRLSIRDVEDTDDAAAATMKNLENGVDGGVLAAASPGSPGADRGRGVDGAPHGHEGTGG